MSNEGKQEGVSMILGAITAAGIGSFLFQALGVLILGIIGALGGWIFEHLLKPRLNKLKAKIMERKA